MIDGKMNDKLLTSWKEIAGYLGKGVRTVQRWERELALPVRRPAHSRHIVVAVTTDLDGWIAQLQQPAPLRCCNCREELDQALNTVQQLQEQLAKLQADGSSTAQFERAAKAGSQDLSPVVGDSGGKAA